MKRWLLVFISVCAALPACYAQSNGLYYLNHKYEEDPFDELTYLQTGINYVSNNVYLGRKDSVALPYMSPYVGYHLHNGLYFRGTVSYAPTRKSGHFDLLLLEAGYDRTFGDRVLAGAYASKDIYHKNSPGIRASAKEGVGMYMQRKDGFIEPQATLEVNIGRHQDYLLGLTADHDYHLDNNRLNIIPGLTVYAGTRHFYDDYIVNRLKKADKTLVIDQVMNDASQFRPLDIDVNVKTTYRSASGWLLTFVPTYAIPLSPASINLPGRVVGEHVTNTFYIELDVCYRAERK